MSKKQQQSTRFYWKRCYEQGLAVHWALCDTATDSEQRRFGQRVTCVEMILLAGFPEVCGMPLSERYFPKLIVELLNEHYSKLEGGKHGKTN
jgi:hypothetical protein